METGNDLVSEADTKENLKKDKKTLMTMSPEVKLQGQTEAKLLMPFALVSPRVASLCDLS